ARFRSAPTALLQAQPTRKLGTARLSAERSVLVRGTARLAQAAFEAPPAPPPPPPQPKKKKKSCGEKVGGAISGAAKAVGGAVKGAVSAIGSAAKSVGKAIGGAAKSVGSAIGSAAKSAVSAIGSAAKSVGKAIGSAAKSVGKAIGSAARTVWNGVKTAAKATWEGIKVAGKAVADFWGKYGDYIVLGLTVITAVVPGLQGVALALAAYQAVKGGVMVYQGIKEGDWKKAVMGGLSVVTAFAGGVGALGARAVGQGLFAAANVAGKVAGVAQRGVMLAEAIQSGNPAGIIGAAAGTVAGGLDLAGGKAAEIGAKLASYGAKAMNLADALQSGQWDRVAGAGLSLGAAAVGDLASKDDAALQNLARKAERTGQYIQVGGTVARAIGRGDVMTAANATLSVAGSVAADLGASRETVNGINKGAKYVRTGMAFVDAASKGNVEQVAWLTSDLAAQAARDLGADKAAGAIAKATGYARGGVELARGIQSGDANRIADAATTLGQLGYGAIQDLLADDEQTAGGAGKGNRGGEQPKVERRPRPSTIPGTRRDGASPDDVAAREAALEVLSPADRAAFDRVAQAVAGNPRAQRALDSLLLVGALEDRAVVGGRRLVEILDGMRAQPLAGGIDSAALLAQTLIEMDDPTSISQMDKNTCGATVVQMTIARDNPAEYARIVAGLASPAGRVTLPSGQTAVRASDWQSRDGGRSVPSRLIQPAFMNLAAASSGGSYDNARDRVTEADGNRHQGLYNAQEAGLLRAAQGGRVEEYRLPSEGGSASAEQMVDRISRALEEGRPAVALIKDSRIGGHYVQVTAISGGRVYYQNPWGQLESLTLDAFKSQLRGLSIAVRGDQTLLQRQLGKLAG
ncbi:MAG: hypothetical protein FJZ01_27550, partial [Candidatus Sericytochromatia bacterium]|nr:hypothetical protein [Candidatus Tanganyikabacteria bacterium]